MGRHSLYRRHLRIVPGIQGRDCALHGTGNCHRPDNGHRHLWKVYRNAVVIVVFVMRAFYFPHLAGYHSVQSPHGADQGSQNSRVKREKPRLESSSIKEDIRCVTSPKAMPPRVVAIRSLMAGGSTSAAISHIKLPAKAYGADSQR